jgi:hypothetical protein
MDGTSLHAYLRRIWQFQNVSDARNDCGTPDSKNIKDKSKPFETGIFER